MNIAYFQCNLLCINTKGVPKIYTVILQPAKNLIFFFSSQKIKNEILRSYDLRMAEKVLNFIFSAITHYFQISKYIAYFKCNSYFILHIYCAVNKQLTQIKSYNLYFCVVFYCKLWTFSTYTASFNSTIWHIISSKRWNIIYNHSTNICIFYHFPSIF